VFFVDIFVKSGSIYINITPEDLRPLVQFTRGNACLKIILRIT